MQQSMLRGLNIMERLYFQESNNLRKSRHEGYAYILIVWTTKEPWGLRYMAEVKWLSLVKDEPIIG